MVAVFLGLGSNMGDKRGYLTAALDLISKHPQIQLVQVASFYETEPVGYTDQDLFVNTVAQIETSLEPKELLRELNRIEQQLGRERLFKWGPRTVDIDILTYGQATIEEADLIIPHKEIKNRAFVLIPLLELAPEYRFPTGEKGSEILAKLIAEKGCLEVKKML